MNWLSRAAMIATLLMTAGAAQAAGNPKKGQTLVKARCGTCHAIGADSAPRMGPTLAGVAARKAGSLAGFGYSPAMKGTKLAWTSANLDQFLAAPSKKVPGTSMMAAVPSAQDRADIVAYLSTLKK